MPTGPILFSRIDNVAVITLNPNPPKDGLGDSP